MTGFEPANGGITTHCRNHLATPAMMKKFRGFLVSLSSPLKKVTVHQRFSGGADSGNRTRTSCLEGKGTTTMQYPLFFIRRL